MSAPTTHSTSQEAVSSQDAAPSAAARDPRDKLFPPGPDGKPARVHEFHDARGKFTFGNPGGPGNPYARQTAAFRRKFQSCVKEEDIEKAYEVLAKAAHSGNVPALRLFFEYVVGKSAKAQDPDRVDAHEWQLAEETVVTGEELARVNNAPTMEANLKMTRMFRPLLTSAGMGNLATMLRDGPPPEPEVEDISILDQPAKPMPNGPTGAALAANIYGTPSANAAIGAGRSGEPSRTPTTPCDAALQVPLGSQDLPMGNDPIGARAMEPPPLDNGPIGPDEAAQVSVLGHAKPSRNGKKRREPAGRR